MAEKGTGSTGSTFPSVNIPKLPRLNRAQGAQLLECLVKLKSEIEWDPAEFLEGKPSFRLAKDILVLLQQSGARPEQARAALGAALALLPEVLPDTFTIEARSSAPSAPTP